jgi:hypothetical protein
MRRYWPVRFPARWLPVMGFVIVVVWCSPLWMVSQKVGIYDWDSSMQRFEAMRVTIAEFQQWPGNNIWMTGGTPLIGNPNSSVLSIKGLLVLTFGTFWGLRLGVIVYLAVGFFGAWRLSGIWWQNASLRTTFALLVVANPAMAYHTAVGHLVFQTFWFTPLLLFYLLRMHHDRYSGLKVGLLFGIGLNDSPAYMVQYQGVTVCILTAWMLFRDRASVADLARFSYLCIPTVLFLGFYRITNLFPVAVEFPRVAGIGYHLQPMDILGAYLFPYISLDRLCPENRFSITWEVCCYLGGIACLFWLVGLLRGFRWWHSMTLIMIWASCGNDAWFYPMFWLQKLPTFASHLCFTRIRVFAQLFFCIGVVMGLDECRQRYCTTTGRGGWIVLVAILVMVGEVLLVSHQILRQSHLDFTVDDNATYSVPFRSIGTQPRPPQAQGRTSFVYLATRKNVGWLRGFGVSWFPEPTKAIGYDEAGYISEYHQKGKAVSPVLWSPNRLSFKNLDPSVPLVLNMNKSRAWYSQGRPVFPQARIVDMSAVMTVIPDSSGVVDIQYVYPGQHLGLAGTVFFGFLLLGIIVHIRFSFRNSREDNIIARGQSGHSNRNA